MTRLVAGGPRINPLTLVFRLPFPPSVNSMYSQGTIGGKTKKVRAAMFLSERGKAYRTAAWVAICEQGVPRDSLRGRLAVKAIAYPPDARVRDLDNLWKSALDVLKHNSVITDDGHIDDLHIVRGAIRPGGVFAIEVSEIATAFESRPLELDLAPPKHAVGDRPPF
jgi:crossover junction endodeoxyribonuclease RusA